MTGLPTHTGWILLLPPIHRWSFPAVCLRGQQPCGAPKPLLGLKSFNLCECNRPPIKSSAETSKQARPGAGRRATQPGLDSGSREISALLPQTLSPLHWPLPAWLLNVWYPLGITFSSHQVSCQHLQIPKTHPMAGPLSAFLVSSLRVYVVCVCVHMCAHVCAGSLPHAYVCGGERPTVASSPTTTCFELGSLIGPGAHCLG